MHVFLKDKFYYFLRILYVTTTIIHVFHVFLGETNILQIDIFYVFYVTLSLRKFMYFMRTDFMFSCVLCDNSYYVNSCIFRGQILH